MQTLRRAHLLARFVLAWFVLAIGVAIASPLVKPQSMELVCTSGSALKLIIKSDDGQQVHAGHTLDCPLCATVGAPPPLLQLAVTAPSDLVHALRPLAVDPVASPAAAPLAARGPPSRA
jgi:hypothetical protein